MTPEELYGLALSDLGQKIINAITATNRLGHTELRNTLRYYHVKDDLSVRLVTAVIDGDAGLAVEALAAWVDGHADEMARKYPELAATRRRTA